MAYSPPVRAVGCLTGTAEGGFFAEAAEPIGGSKNTTRRANPNVKGMMKRLNRPCESDPLLE